MTLLPPDIGGLAFCVAGAIFREVAGCHSLLRALEIRLLM